MSSKRKLRTNDKNVILSIAKRLGRHEPKIVVQKDTSGGPLIDKTLLTSVAETKIKIRRDPVPPNKSLKTNIKYMTDLSVWFYGKEPDDEKLLNQNLYLINNDFSIPRDLSFAHSMQILVAAFRTVTSAENMHIHRIVKLLTIMIVYDDEIHEIVTNPEPGGLCRRFLVFRTLYSRLCRNFGLTPADYGIDFKSRRDGKESWINLIVFRGGKRGYFMEEFTTQKKISGWDAIVQSLFLKPRREEFYKFLCNIARGKDVIDITADRIISNISHWLKPEDLPKQKENVKYLKRYPTVVCHNRNVDQQNKYLIVTTVFHEGLKTAEQLKEGAIVYEKMTFTYNMTKEDLKIIPTLANKKDEQNLILLSIRMITDSALRKNISKLKSHAVKLTAERTKLYELKIEHDQENSDKAKQLKGVNLITGKAEKKQKSKKLKIDLNNKETEKFDYVLNKDEHTTHDVPDEESNIYEVEE